LRIKARTDFGYLSDPRNSGPKITITLWEGNYLRINGNGTNQVSTDAVFLNRDGTRETAYAYLDNGTVVYINRSGKLARQVIVYLNSWDEEIDAIDFGTYSGGTINSEECYLDDPRINGDYSVSCEVAQ